MTASPPATGSRPSATFTPPPAPGGRPGGVVAVGLGMVAVGALWLANTLGADIPWRAVLPGALVAVGVALMIGARQARPGLVAVGVVLAVVSVVVVVGGNMTVAMGERTLTPTAAADLEDGYGVAMGRLELDLRQLELAPGTTVVEGQMLMGELLVRVPEGARVVVDGTVAMGELVAFDRRSEGGLAVTVDEAVFGPATGPVLRLELRGMMGKVEVTS